MSNLYKFAENVWIADGPLVKDMKAMFTTRMTIVKLKSGSVWIESPVPVSSETLKEINNLGTVKYLVAATPRHVWRLVGGHTLFPDAQLWMSRPTRLTLKQGDLPPTNILTDIPPPEWKEDFEQLTFKGNPLMDEVLFYHKQSHTVILNDLIVSNRKIKGKYYSNLVFKLAGVAYPRSGVARDIKMSFIKRKLARQSLEKLLSWDFDKLIIAHGDCIENEAKSFVKEKFRWLTH